MVVRIKIPICCIFPEQYNVVLAVGALMRPDFIVSRGACREAGLEGRFRYECAM